MTIETKFRSLENLKTIVQEEKAHDKKIIFANGCFDLLHVGHVRYLQDAAKLGDTLVVAINSDSSVRRIKGEGRPHTKEEDRVEIIAALECVDYVLLFDEPDVSNLLLTLKPHVQAKGTDYTKESVPEAHIVKSYGGEVAITGDEKSRSSTEMIQKLKQ